MFPLYYWVLRDHQTRSLMFYELSQIKATGVMVNIILTTQFFQRASGARNILQRSASNSLLSFCWKSRQGFEQLLRPCSKPDRSLYTDLIFCYLWYLLVGSIHYHNYFLDVYFLYVIKNLTVINMIITRIWVYWEGNVGLIVYFRNLILLKHKSICCYLHLLQF